MERTPDSRIHEADPATVARWLRGGKAVLVDVREPWEFAEERIPGAMLAPLSGFDPRTFSAAGGKRLVLHCLGNTRSTTAGRMLLEAGFAEAFTLKDGLMGWSGAGFATES